MCEGHERKAHFEGIRHLIEPLLASHNWHIRGLWADATEEQEAEGNWPDHHPAASGLVYQLGPKDPHEVLRCHQNIRPIFLADDTHPNGPYALPLDTLELKGFHYTSRALLIDFGPAWLQADFLTHSSIQLFTKDVWVNSICKMKKPLRPFKVAMAIEFDDHVFAILSKDLLFKGTWGRTRDSFKKCPEIGDDLNGFIEKILEWMDKRINSAANRDGLAVDAIQDALDVWPGHGPYTTNEHFWLSGLSQFLTEAEVFNEDDPSRLIRYILSAWTWDKKGREGILKLIRPAYREGLMAPTLEQRKSYMRWLHVYAQDRTWMPDRMGELLEYHNSKIEFLGKQRKSWSRAETTDLYDVFEPTYLREALELPQNFGHLIFGKKEWAAMGGKPSDGLDPLSMYYRPKPRPSVRPKGWKPHIQRTYLRPNFYKSLFVDLNKNMCHRSSFFYRGPKYKQIWSNVLPFPYNSLHGLPYKTARKPAPMHVKVESVKNRNKKLFSHLISGNNVAIGPLEYYGNTFVYKAAGGYHKVAVSKKDPMIPEYYSVQLAKGRARKELGLDRGKKRKGPMPDEARDKMDQLVANIRSSHMGTSSSVQDATKEGEPVKKRRLGADFKMAEDVSSEMAGAGRSSRSRGLKPSPPLPTTAKI